LVRIKQWVNTHGTEIYQMGRSGGWLYLDTADVIDMTIYEQKMNDEGDEEYAESMLPLKGLFEDLWNFQEWYQKVLEEVKKCIDYFECTAVNE
jgi:hypothetical protein